MTRRFRLRTAYESGRRISSDPLVHVVDDFATEAECAHVIGLAQGRLDTAMVSAVGDATPSTGRTGSVAWLRHDQSPTVQALVGGISDFVGVPSEHAESLQVVHYEVGEQYKPHFDAYDLTTEKGRQRTEHGGQRLVTALLYLNAVDDGGGTVFPRLDLEISAHPGRLVVFHNVADRSLSDHARHSGILHGSAPVTVGEKWACNLWFRAEPYF